MIQEQKLTIQERDMTMRYSDEVQCEIIHAKSEACNPRNETMRYSRCCITMRDTIEGEGAGPRSYRSMGPLHFESRKLKVLATAATKPFAFRHARHCRPHSKMLAALRSRAIKLLTFAASKAGYFAAIIYTKILRRILPTTFILRLEPKPPKTK